MEEEAPAEETSVDDPEEGEEASTSAQDPVRSRSRSSRLPRVLTFSLLISHRTPLPTPTLLSTLETLTTTTTSGATVDTTTTTRDGTGKEPTDTSGSKTFRSEESPSESSESRF